MLFPENGVVASLHRPFAVGNLDENLAPWREEVEKSIQKRLEIVRMFKKMSAYDNVRTILRWDTLGILSRDPVLTRDSAVRTTVTPAHN